MDRLLSERDKYHQADKENRLEAIEKRLEEDNKPSAMESFLTPEVISGIVQYVTQPKQ